MASLLLLLPDKSVNFVPQIRGTLAKHFATVTIHSDMPRGWAEIAMLVKAKKATHVATTSFAVLKLLDPMVEGSASESIGAIVNIPSFKKDDGGVVAPLLLLPPLVSCFENGGTFLIDHYLAKMLGKHGVTTDKLRWEILEPHRLEPLLLLAKRSFLCAVDIETHKEGRRITSVSYTFAYKGAAGEVTTHTAVLRCDAAGLPFWLIAMRKLNATKVAKVMHNGQYDSAYFLRFNAPVTNWIYDTYNLSHALFPELPKRLDFCAGMYLADFRFWKDESASNLYEYNAKDTHATLWVFLAMMQYCSQPSNQYALRNFVQVFPTVFPSLSCGMTGVPVNEEKRKELRAAEVAKERKALQSLEVMLGAPGFNPGSPKQVLALLHAMGMKKAEKSDIKTLTAFSELGSIQMRLFESIKAYRGASKAISTYYDVELYDGKLYYSLDPSGTNSSRMASRESHFWCGTQIQNIPGYARAMVLARQGWKMAAVDKAQSESYCTAFIAREPALIHTVTTSPDFHCQNASMFFGIPFNELYDTATKHKLRPDIRNLAKKVNHGANYNMGAFVLLETMGTRSVMDAKRLLNLPANWSLMQVCNHLLSCFDAAYPRIRGEWQQELIREIQTTGKLTSPDGWVIRTFLRPWKSKPDLNSAVSLKPQGLSARLVNKALMRVWKELQLGCYRGKFRLLAQVHDEILFEATEDIVDEAARRVAEMMVVPLTIHGKEMRIPSTKEVGICWKDLK